jgi:proteasome lid subunit RPN8/RPN11
MTVELPGRLLEQLRTHLEAAYPEEGCGVLVGRDREARRTVERVHALANARRRARARAYRIAPEAFLAVEKRARQDGLEVVGFFHSHPDRPARPSRSDLKAAWPYYVYLIGAVSRGRLDDVRAFTLDPGGRRFEAADLRAPLEDRR